jgi:hypothetical protein
MDHQAFAQLLGNYGEFVGAIAVVVTLGYLAFQIRQNTRQLRGEAVLSVNEAAAYTLRAVRDDPELLSLCVRANARWDSIGPREQARVHLYNSEQMSYCESAYNLWMQGALDEATYLSRENVIVSVLTNPGAESWWNDWKHIFMPGFQQRIDDRLSNPTSREVPTTEQYAIYNPVHWEADAGEAQDQGV